MSAIRIALAVPHVQYVDERRALLIEMERRLGGRKGMAARGVTWHVVPELRPPPPPGKRRPKSEAGAWPTAKRAWQTAVLSPGATHAMVMDDDMMPVKDFWEGAISAISTKPDATISFFSMRKVAVEKARARGLSWYASDTYTGANLVMPVDVVADWLHWDAQHMDQTYPHYDWRVSMYHIKHDRLIWSTVPCLMEHARSLSALGHGDPRRRAAWLAQSGAGIDWSKGADKPVMAKTGLSPYPDLVAAYHP